jgi:hypothetical protein
VVIEAFLVAWGFSSSYTCCYLLSYYPLLPKMEVLPLGNALFTVNTMNLDRLAFQRSLPASPNSPEFYAFQKLLRDTYHSATLDLQNVERQRGYLHRIYKLQSLDKTIFTLKCSPSRDTHLMRHEHKSLETEARVIDLINANTHVPTPQRIAYDSQAINAIGAPFLLRSYIPGATLADVERYLSTDELSDIDRMLGSYLFSMFQVKERSFGLFHRVNAGTGHHTWGEAFQSLVESVLRDAEDMLVSLPYDSIRYHVSVRKTILDQITVPRLTAMDAGDARHVLLDQGRHQQIVGLLGLSNVIWGDPMLAGVFSGASREFWDGFGGKPPQDDSQRIRGLL